MKPAPFSYYRPATVDEALHQLNQYPNAKILAGGQSLIPMMNMRLAHPDVLIDINQIPALGQIHDDPSHLVVGALTRHWELEESPLIEAHCPVIVEAERLIAHAAIRTRGTIGGSLAHADPAAELPVLARLLDFEFIVESVDGIRAIPAEAFFLSYFITGLMPNELLTAIRIPKNPSASAHIKEYAIRHGDFALVIAALSISLDQEQHLSHLSIAIGGVADIPWRNRELEQTFLGEVYSDEIARRIAQKVAQELNPVDDLHASAEYRRSLADHLLNDLFRTCVNP